MLSLNKKTGYGLIALAYLAGLKRDELASAREIAQRFDVPVNLLMNVLKQLSADGYIESVRGARGGYRLARDPHDLTVAEVVQTIEGPVQLAECVTADDRCEGQCTCRIIAQCPVADAVHQVHYRMIDLLSHMTLADVAGPTLASAGQTQGR
jgi:Rrf2 family protein